VFTLTIASASFAGLIFLLWFGNYTAEKYRKQYGTLPEVYVESEPARVETDAWKKSPSVFTVASHYASTACMSVICSPLYLNAVKRARLP